MTTVAQQGRMHEPDPIDASVFIRLLRERTPVDIVHEAHPAAVRRLEQNAIRVVIHAVYHADLETLRSAIAQAEAATRNGPCPGE